MHMDFECHITVPLDQKVQAKRVMLEMHSWTDSEIERDPLLGKASYFYLTTHGWDYLHVYGRMKAMVGALTQDGVSVIREKIELIVYDTKNQK